MEYAAPTIEDGQRARMKFLLVAVGHKMPSWITTGFAEYVKRMPPSAKVELIEVRQEPRTTGKSVAKMLEAEACRIATSLPEGTQRVVLDEHGASYTTKQFAQKMQDWMGGGRDVTFVIGGADGLHESIKNGTQKMALSSMTLPHGLVRVLLAEQLYRAYSLLHNHHYHRE